MTQAHKTDSMRLDPSVIDTIISLTASEVDGVASVGTSAPAGIFARLTHRPATAGIDCEMQDDGKLKIALHISVDFGFVIPEVAQNVREAIADALAVHLGLEVSSVAIYVDGISFSQN